MLSFKLVFVDTYDDLGRHAPFDPFHHCKQYIVRGIISNKFNTIPILTERPCAGPTVTVIHARNEKEPVEVIYILS